jgi:2-polyprenyl-3-methyl-5-hydroxy-6-metoxy-1,4-benzoquinol methylase
LQKFQIVKDSLYGYYKLDPTPSEGTLSEFYQKRYSDLIRKGGRAPDLKKQLEGNEKAKIELEWLRETLYEDIYDVLNSQFSKQEKRILDVGCGLGKFLTFLAEKGCHVIGIEPSEEQALLGREAGIEVYNMGIEAFIKKYSKFRRFFDSIVFLNVLEHLPYPENILKLSKALLSNDGVICLRVPNDFSDLQVCAQKKLDHDEWWVNVPDHINYFNSESLSNLVTALGFEPTQVTMDFPMELFLLMGIGYIGNPELGGDCHNKRISFELSVPSALRRKLYKNLAEIGIGRNILLFAKLKTR